MIDLTTFSVSADLSLGHTLTLDAPPGRLLTWCYFACASPSSSLHVVSFHHESPMPGFIGRKSRLRRGLTHLYSRTTKSEGNDG